MEDRLRNLVTVRRVAEIKPIEGADAIELAIIDGWQTVIKKGELHPGEYCLYFEIDSFLPVKPEFEFLRKSSYKKYEDGTEGFRLKTVRLRGQISQGLALPFTGEILHTLMKIAGPGARFDDFMGKDLSELYGVTKWEPADGAVLSGDAKGLFPSHSRKSDQERIQNLSRYFELYADEEFEGSIKLDGSSMTVFFHRGDFGVCSRNLELKEDEGNTFWKVANNLDLKNRMTKLGLNISIQGELCGEGIQGNKEKLRGHDFFVFDIWDQDKHRYMTPDERMNIMNILNSDGGPQIKHVPVLGRGLYLKEYNSVAKLLELADGPSLHAKTREGIVFKSLRPINNEIVSFKVINTKFLLDERD